MAHSKKFKNNSGVGVPARGKRDRRASPFAAGVGNWVEEREKEKEKFSKKKKKKKKTSSLAFGKRWGISFFFFSFYFFSLSHWLPPSSPS